MKVTRGQFLFGGVGAAALALAGRLGLSSAQAMPSGRIVGASSSVGHRLWRMDFPKPAASIRKRVVIVGGGIAGLSAAWQLRREGIEDFVLLELENQVGGNAGSGENAVSAYPWGAHYVPLLNEESTEAHALFEDLGIIRGRENGAAVYDDYFISADPHERLFIHGRWQEGLVPQVGFDATDRNEYHAFFAAMEAFKGMVGSDGKRAFAIPVDRSSQDAEWRALDRISFADYLDQNGWTSPYLRWYADYCCRDDYGATAGSVSAWAGIHYFAGRRGRAANADTQSVITWPEGNGWIVHRLRDRLSEHLRTGAIAYRVERTGSGLRVYSWNSQTDTSTTIEADAVILATPRFVAERLFRTGTEMADLHYSPWMVANVTLDKLPEGKGAPLSWDNMIYDSEMLGYVNATNQSLARVKLGTVLTYYWPLSHIDPAAARKEMIARSYEDWRTLVLDDLLRVHPELEGHVLHLDVWLWGHGMIRPVTGYIWGETRQKLASATPPIFHAHSDMSGISIFEEANYHGVQAARDVAAYLAAVGRTPT